MTERRQTSSGNKGPRGSRCSDYSEQEVIRYLTRAMTGTEIDRFEAHAEGCDECRRLLYRCHLEQEGRKDEEFARRSMALWDRLQGAPAENLLELVMKASGKLLELVSTTGELLRPPTLVTVRGDAAGGDAKTEPLRIVKELASPPISIQASAELGSDGAMELRISLYDRKKEEFMPGVGVEFTGAGILEEMMTDGDGEVLFTIAAPGDYRVTLTSGRDRIGEIGLTLEM